MTRPTVCSTSERRERTSPRPARKFVGCIASDRAGAILPLYDDLDAHPTNGGFSRDVTRGDLAVTPVRTAIPARGGEWHFRDPGFPWDPARPIEEAMPTLVVDPTRRFHPR